MLLFACAVLLALAGAPFPVRSASDPPRTAALDQRRVSPDSPLRVYVAGDSIAEWPAYDLAEYAARDGLIHPQIDFTFSSGLTNPTFFDWPARLASALSVEPPPEVVVLILGANDDQPMATADGVAELGSPAWTLEYRQRAARMMDLAAGAGAWVYWVTQPVQRDQRRQAVMETINATLIAEASTRPWVRIVDDRPLFADELGHYTAYRPGPSGQLVRVRQDDGVHLTREGAAWVADLVYRAIQADWIMPAATTQTGTA